MESWVFQPSSTPVLPHSVIPPQCGTGPGTNSNISRV
jgi:hypothetical protein